MGYSKRLADMVSVALATAGITGFITTALAAEMTGAEITTYFSDKTAYIETPVASGSGAAGQAVIYWASDRTALYRTPSGAMMHGIWEIKDNTLCPAWKERPNTGCIRFEKIGDAVTAFDAKSGALGAKILKTAPGNAENLAP
jgi:hypothetical protein